MRMFETYICRVLLFLCLLPLRALAQDAPFVRGYAQLGTIASKGDYAPFWFTARQQGVPSLETSNSYARYALFAGAPFKEGSDWSYNVAADVVVGYNRENTLFPQQLYGEVSWRRLTLSLGCKERFSELKGFAAPCASSSFSKNGVNTLFPHLYANRFSELSSGGLVYSGNSAPVPQLRLEIPQYVPFPGTKGWLGVKGHIAYGFFADGSFQENFTRENPTARYGKNIFYHSKALFINVGKPSRFPLTFEGGLEMYTQFGGDIYNHKDGKVLSMPSGVKDFFKAFIPMSGGEDTPEYEQTNISGNNVGSWHAALTLHTRVADVRVYAEHMFEDFSQLFFFEYQSDANGDRNLIYYPWRDILVGVSVANKSGVLPFISNFLYEYLSTYDQSGAGYNDPGPFFKEQMDGADNYYNHSIYPGWHNMGMGLGSPLAVSPAYNKNGSLRFRSNRFVAHTVGVNGTLGVNSPFAYRLQYTYSENWGTYLNPLDEKKYTTSLLADVIYAPAAGKWAGSFAIGYDKSNFIGENLGVMFTITRAINYKE